MFSAPKFAFGFLEAPNYDYVSILYGPINLFAFEELHGLRQRGRTNEIVLASIVCSLNNLHFCNVSHVSAYNT
jgi:hypothetical protein